MHYLSEITNLIRKYVTRRCLTVKRSQVSWIRTKLQNKSYFETLLKNPKTNLKVHENLIKVFNGRCKLGEQEMAYETFDRKSDDKGSLVVCGRSGRISSIVVIAVQFGARLH